MGQTIALNEPNTRTFGNLTLHATRTIDGGYALNVWAGMERISALGITTADRATFRAHYRMVAEAALAGTKAERIASDITDAERAVLAAANEVVAAVKDDELCGVCDMRPCGCPTFRTDPIPQTPPTPPRPQGPRPGNPFPSPWPTGPCATPLTALADTFTPHRRETRPTKTGDQTISAALRGLLQVGAARESGIINRGNGEASIVQLQALDRRGLADLIRSGRHIIGGRLTVLGWREAAKAVF